MTKGKTESIAMLISILVGFIFIIMVTIKIEDYYFSDEAVEKLGVMLQQEKLARSLEAKTKAEEATRNIRAFVKDSTASVSCEEYDPLFFYMNCSVMTKNAIIPFKCRPDNMECLVDFDKIKPQKDENGNDLIMGYILGKVF